jgi:predicted NAD-dependent protein-ADP-ribosyltransferase YbiA (DUF1768 family)
MKPLIIAFFDGDEEVKILSNLAHTPFQLDGMLFASAEAFWQCLKTEDPIMRDKIAGLVDALDAMQLGRRLATAKSLFSYQGQLYKVGSKQHHLLLERAIRAKVDQNEAVEKSLWNTGEQPLKHMLRNKYGVWHPGDSPACPAFVFESILLTIRGELRNQTFQPSLPLPEGLISSPFLE